MAAMKASNVTSNPDANMTTNEAAGVTANEAAKCDCS